MNSKAISFLLSFVLSRSSDAGALLPPIRELAQKAGVAPGTMSKAARLLKEQGVLGGVPGHRYTILAGNSNAGEALSAVGAHAVQKRSTRRCLWQRIATMLEKDILVGNLLHGTPLPSVKELTVRYSVTYSTIRKALDSLEHRGLLLPHKRTYRLNRQSPKNSRSRIVLLAPGDPDGRMLFIEQNERLVQDMETACRKAGTALRPVSYFFEDDRLRFASVTEGVFETLPPSDDVLGYMLAVCTELAVASPERVLQHLRPMDKPVAVLDQIGEWKLPSYMSTHETTLFTMGHSSYYGRVMGQFLLEEGHRTVAFVSPYHAFYWSRNRCRGLGEVYEKGGATLHAFTAEDIIHFPRIRTESKEYYNVGEMDNWYAQWRQDLQPELRALLDPHIDYVGKELVIQAATRRALFRLFDQIPLKQGFTAWVCANDQVAVNAYDYLEQKKIRVPEDLTLVSFDNTKESMLRGITSYDFNISGAVQAMIGAVLWPSMGRGSFRNGDCIEGYVIKRRSSRAISTPVTA